MSVVNATNRAASPEDAAAMTANDVADFMEQHGLSKDDVTLTASCVSVITDYSMEYVYSIIITYNEPQRRIQGVTRRLGPGTRRLHPSWTVRELEPAANTIDRDLVTSFLGCPTTLLSYIVATLYGVFEGQQLILITSSWDVATAVANRANTEG